MGYKDYNYINYKNKGNFCGKSGEEHWFNDYIKKETTDILNNVFEEPNNINLNHKIYEKLITGDRKEDILKYQEFELVSPQIYNIVYIYLVYICKRGKNITKCNLSHYVKINKEHMKKIEEHGYTPKQYWSQYWQTQNEKQSREDRIHTLLYGNTPKW